jgi:CheY-like chemotaxis protein
VLVVDDEHDVQQVVSGILTQDGAKVTAVIRPTRHSPRCNRSAPTSS